MADKGAVRDIQAVTVRMPTDIYEGVRVLAYATQTSINELVVQSVSSYLADAGHREAVDAFANQVRDQYRVALDKLADL